ncbi:HPr kinase/phosphorylase [Aestuariivirga sp.]|jgi:serine kinase of HPr protein (carbohydrate metabolism regulator)|uniref:HPr kinase/phosphorylase n=1 Tax=Aestuariivirga sp. TaxID=2650926 RepID=UPI0037848049
MTETALMHGTCLALGEDGVLLLGEPGSGKSDLALRLIDAAGGGLSGHLRPARLVADDQVLIRRQASRLMATAPPALSGMLEIRGLGLARVTTVPEIALTLAVRLTPANEIERMPDLASARIGILGIGLPLIRLDPIMASAPARLRAALDQFVPR